MSSSSPPPLSGFESKAPTQPGLAQSTAGAKSSTFARSTFGRSTRVDDDMEDATDRFQGAIRAPVSPHELTDERRDEYAADLWNMFQAKAVRGHVSWDDAVQLAVSFPIEGANAESMEKLRPDDVDPELAFEDMVVLFDRVSRDASEEFRDIDMEQRDAQDEVELPPHKYLWSKMPCSSYPKDVRYRLEDGWRLDDMKPKTKLIITTAVLMVIIGVSLLVIIYELWSNSNHTREEQSFFTTRSTLHYLINKYELSFYEDHFYEMADQTVIVAGLSDFFMRRAVENQLARNVRTAERVESMSTVPASLLSVNAAAAAAVELAELGVEFDEGALTSVLAAESAELTDLFSNVTVPMNATASENLCAETAQQVGAADRTLFVPPARTNTSARGMCIASTLASRPPPTAEFISNINPVDVNGTTVAVIGDPSYTPSDRCFTIDDEYVCDSVDALVASQQDDSAVINGSNTVMFNNGTALFAMIKRSNAPGWIVVATSEAQLRTDKQDEFILEVQHLNWAFVRTTEIVVGRFEPSVGRFVTQVTNFRFGGCYAECERLPPARRNAERSWRTRGPAGSITPDYRPEPIAGTSQYLPTMEAVLLLERDVQEIRGLGLTSLIEIINDLTLSLPDVEINAFRHVGQPPMRDFDPFTPCAADEDCLSLPPPVGVFFKYNCVHCQRVIAFERNATIEFLTKLKKPMPPGVTEETVPFDDVYAEILYERTNVTRVFTDYANDEVLGHGFFIVNYSIGVMVKIDADRFRQLWWWEPTFAVLMSACMLFVGLGLILISTNLSLSSMERDWLTAKEEIEREKAHFARIVGDLVPPNLSQRMLRGQKVVAETLNNAVVVFADVCSFTESTNNLSAKHTVRFAAYCFHSLQLVADDCQLLRLGSVGDTYIVYGSTPASYKSDPQSHAAFRGARYGVLASMVFSPLVHHWPETVRGFRDGFKDRARATEPFKVPRIRFGAHCGVIPSGIIQGDGAPRFDLYGLVPALAARMCTTSSPDRLHVTAFMRDAIAGNDINRTFLFDDPRKTIVRGQGTVTSYFVRATAHDLSNELIDSLHVKRAPLTVTFDGRKRRSRSLRGGSPFDMSGSMSDRQSSKGGTGQTASSK